MIEHFKKFDADNVKSILPLSFSQITDFAFKRDKWALRRIFGYEFPSNAGSERGKAVESGLNMWLNGIDKKEAIDKMFDEFHANCKLFDDPKTDEEEYNLIPLFEEGVKAFNEFAFILRISKQKRIFTLILKRPSVNLLAYLCLMLCNNLFIKEAQMQIKNFGI